MSAVPPIIDAIINIPELEGEILKVTASDANELHIVASILEINRD